MTRSKYVTSELNAEMLAVLLEKAQVREKGWKDKGYFQSASGKPCFILAPELSDINIDDIAVCLARISRWGGRTLTYRDFKRAAFGAGPLLAMSVAQHSVITSYLCDGRHALVALLHDATEAYLGDVISPLKRLIRPLYSPIEIAWAKRIGEIFGLGDALAYLPTDVQCADLLGLEIERWDLMPQDGPAVWGHDERPTSYPMITPLDEIGAFHLFLQRFKELTK